MQEEITQGRGLPLGGGGQDDRGPAPKGPEEGAGGDEEKALPAHPPPGQNRPCTSSNSMGASLTNIEITEQNIKAFSAVAKKYDIDYALKKDPIQNPRTTMCFSRPRTRTSSNRLSRSSPP